MKDKMMELADQISQSLTNSSFPYDELVNEVSGTPEWEFSQDMLDSLAKDAIGQFVKEFERMLVTSFRYHRR